MKAVSFAISRTQQCWVRRDRPKPPENARGDATPRLDHRTGRGGQDKQREVRGEEERVTEFHLKVDDAVTLERETSEAVVNAFAEVSGDHSPNQRAV
jgi:hypothetical protein